SLDTLARTLYGEACGEGEAGMVAVASVILNRIALSEPLGGRHWYGFDIRSVCRAIGQFSCWLPVNRNRSKLLEIDDRNPEFRLALAIAADAIAGRIEDTTYSATSF